MGAVGLWLVCNSGPTCTADLAKILIFFVSSLVNEVAFPSFLLFPPFLPFFCPHADFFYFLFYLRCFMLPSSYCLKVRLLF